MSTSQPPLSAALPGTWALLSRIDVTDAGVERAEPSLGADPVALLIYDRAGHFSAQFMKRDRTEAGVSRATEGGANNSRAVNGYDAYFGTYSVDDAKGTVTQRLLGSLTADNVGLVLSRKMTVDGDRLIIRLRTSVDGEPVDRTLTWRRIG